MGPPARIPSPSEAARAYLRSLERPIRAWLDANEERVFTLSESAVTFEVMRAVPSAADYGVASTRWLIRDWVLGKGRRLPPVSALPHPADRRPPVESRPSPIARAVEDAISTLTDGADVDLGPFNTTIAIGGLTSRFNLPRGGRAQVEVSPSGSVDASVRGPGGGANVGTQGASVTLNPSHSTTLRFGMTWQGVMNFSTRVSQFNFRSALSRDRWSVRLTFPSSRMPQDVSRLGEVFRSGESAIRDTVVRAGQIDNPGEIPAAVEELSDQFDSIKRMVSAASDIAARPPALRFGIEASGPGFSPGPDASRDTRVMGVLNVSF